MTLLGIDLNATRARAVSGPAADFPLPVPLDPPALELPLLVSLEQNVPEVGQAGLRLRRRSPHLVCQNFLAHLPHAPAAAKEEAGGPRWTAGRHTLDTRQVLKLVWQRLAPMCSAAARMVLAVPAYLTPGQIEVILQLARQPRGAAPGCVPTPLALALAAYAEQPWFGHALIADVDDYALTLSTVFTGDGQVELVEARVFPHLGLQAWKERLLNALADCCVLQSRRDPRDCPAAEQALYEQLDTLLDAGRQGRVVQLSLPGASWYQNLVVQPDQPLGFCAPLLDLLLAEIEAVWNSTWPHRPPGTMLLSAAAGRLPGLASALHRRLDEWTPFSADLSRRAGFQADGPRCDGPRRLEFPADGQAESLSYDGDTVEEDFGDSLLGGEELQAAPTVLLLPEDAPARGAHALAARFDGGEALSGFHERVPLPLPQAPHAGPARLHFQGQDYFLNQADFTLGAQPGCNLVFPADDYLGVSPRHCEIVFDHRAFMLFDRSRVGTLVNDRPVIDSVVLRAGDWIRLGPEGPLLRFLGGRLNRPAPLTA